MIRVATAAVIRRYDQDAHQTLPRLTHAGVEDAFLGKASVVWYWQQGKWLRLAGAD